MGNYNPSVPIILGQEWVPIRDEDLVFSPSVNVVEKGHSFTLAASRQVRDGRFYTHQLASDSSPFQTAQMGIYPAGFEDASGPIQQVLIPCNNGGITGTGISVSGGANVGTCLFAPGDGFVFVVYSGGLQDLSMFFATNSYPQLSGKRILNVSFIYSGVVADFLGGKAVPFVDPDPTTPLTSLYMLNDAAIGTSALAPYQYANTGSLSELRTALNPASQSVFFSAPYGSVNLGDVFPIAISGAGTDERLPWLYSDLQRFEASAASRLHMHVIFQIPSTNSGANAAQIRLDYAALQVTYCEEQRVAVGGKIFTIPYSVGMNSITMRSIARVADPVLAAGEYSVVLSWVNPGDVDFGLATNAGFPELNAVRELYDIPPHPGVQVNLPFPLEDHLGDTFTAEQTHILPHLSLHASGGTLTEPHIYGRQAAAQVYGAVTATQEIYDDLVGVATTYPQVRWYARRFGADSGTLTLSGGGSLSGSTVSITSADFDGLPQIIDGWREVTLRFDTPPAMGTLVSPEPSWTWSAASAVAGTRWEILGACAPAISGIASNPFNLVPSPNQLYEGTYQPPAGSTVELAWLPQGCAGPPVTGVAADQATDAALLFSTDPPTVTGFAVTPATQIVSGIGLDCGNTPCCIPTGISYNQLTWSPTSLPVSGFGTFQLQRWDSVTDWQTIMSASSPNVTGFNDFEARVGLDSVYRIRATNLYDFAGDWSTQVTGSVAAPGVQGCAVDGGVLIFTTNEDQTGASNLAYSPNWETGAEETFDFPEAEQVLFQRMYGRDGVTAFHGTERGLEHFTRLLLIQQAAIDPIRLANLRSLRDLAWADLPYVCVRDDIGDRWFANVRVPNESVRLRALYMATVDITELTQTASPTDPAG